MDANAASGGIVNNASLFADRLADGVSLSGDRLVIFGWACLGVVGAAAASPTLAVVSPLAAACSLHGLRSRRRKQRADQRHRQLIELVDHLIQRSKGGGSLGAALRDPHVAHVLVDPGPGSDPSDAAIDNDQRLVMATLAVLTRRGGSALPSLERLSDTLRSSAALGLETDAQAGQATASALALATLPVLFIVGLAVAHGGLRRFYLYDMAGALCVLAATLLSYGGWAMMQRLIDSVR